jgi:hypothetical protein
MTGRPGTPASARSKRLGFLAGLVLLVPAAGQADTRNLLITAEAAPVAAVPAPAGKRPALGLDDAGNVMVRYGGLSLTIIYGASEAVDSLRERAGLLPPVREAAGLGDLTFKVGFAF